MVPQFSNHRCGFRQHPRNSSAIHHYHHPRIPPQLNQFSDVFSCLPGRCGRTSFVRGKWAPLHSPVASASSQCHAACSAVGGQHEREVTYDQSYRKELIGRGKGGVGADREWSPIVQEAGGNVGDNTSHFGTARGIICTVASWLELLCQSWRKCSWWLSPSNAAKGGRSSFDKRRGVDCEGGPSIKSDGLCLSCVSLARTESACGHWHERASEWRGETTSPMQEEAHGAGCHMPPPTYVVVVVIVVVCCVSSSPPTCGVCCPLARPPPVPTCPSAPPSCSCSAVVSLLFVAQHRLAPHSTPSPAAQPAPAKFR